MLFFFSLCFFYDEKSKECVASSIMCFVFLIALKNNNIVTIFNGRQESEQRGSKNKKTRKQNIRSSTKLTMSAAPSTAFFFFVIIYILGVISCCLAQHFTRFNGNRCGTRKYKHTYRARREKRSGTITKKKKQAYTRSHDRGMAMKRPPKQEAYGAY